MRAKFIYETFKEKSDPIKDMGIGSISIIHKWFRTYAPDVKYTIDDDLNIYVKGHLWLDNISKTKLPNIVELPNIVSIEGELDLTGTQITKLPDNLIVTKDLWLEGVPIKKLPNNLNVGGSLDLEYTLISELPKDLKVGGDLWLQGSKVIKIPDNISVGGKIYKDF